MTLSQARAAELTKLCNDFRIDVLTTLHDVQTGHAGGSLSVCEILVTLYMECANISPENQHAPDRDRIILSKGHGAPMLYRCLCEKGFFPKEELTTFRAIGSRLQGHPDMNKAPGIDFSAGFYLLAKKGAYVKEGEPLAVLYANDTQKADLAEERFRNACRIEPTLQK